ncbi:MAG TPA: hypothetical protein VK598_08025 [Nitrospiraceae bacterium]|nr:hypothetical protein [Nitrospiraceae bacterium]
MAIVKSLLSYGLLLLVVVAALYVSRGFDPRDILKPVMRINHH